MQRHTIKAACDAVNKMIKHASSDHQPVLFYVQSGHNAFLALNFINKKDNIHSVGEKWSTATQKDIRTVFDICPDTCSYEDEQELLLRVYAQSKRDDGISEDRIKHMCEIKMAEIIEEEKKEDEKFKLELKKWDENNKMEEE